jgi:hypothetical protein
LTGAIVKRQHQQNAAFSGGGSRRLRRTLPMRCDNYSQNQGEGQLPASSKPPNPVEAQ